ncbi:MAG: hypothetical protein F6K48_24965 [Okeania sp. SIO3H1]|nr:hypothetical protein [Okeania sp. SIO3H1]
MTAFSSPCRAVARGTAKGRLETLFFGQAIATNTKLINVCYKYLGYFLGVNPPLAPPRRGSQESGVIWE